ncbi:hypothetical protein SUGI_0552050 [Cryptomeria japonica]|nr:hypothetical protein SUGI_0552050 [Cryptomeria japonica]
MELYPLLDIKAIVDIISPPSTLDVHLFKARALPLFILLMLNLGESQRRGGGKGKIVVVSEEDMLLEGYREGREVRKSMSLVVLGPLHGNTPGIFCEEVKDLSGNT